MLDLLISQLSDLLRVCFGLADFLALNRDFFFLGLSSVEATVPSGKLGNTIEGTLILLSVVLDSLDLTLCGSLRSRSVLVSNSVLRSNIGVSVDIELRRGRCENGIVRGDSFGEDGADADVISFAGLLLSTIVTVILVDGFLKSANENGL